ncbi:MAG: hypothetical protein KY467_05205 [Gemmatimonadetes bacterium]|nr:hypothetical protein [Gemmatimonadota bacterium]
MINGLMRMLSPRRMSVKNMAMMGAAGWAMNRMGRRGHRAGRMMGTASWALPLGMMAYDRVRARRARRGDLP